MKEKFFSNEIVNKGRQSEIDWAKACAILAMITVHVYERLSVVDVDNTMATGPFRLILEFLAGPLAAPLFMFSMGIGIMYSRNSTPGKMGLRGLKLLRNGYLLNFFKGTIFIIIGTVLGMETPVSIQDSIFWVSILQFAGMAFFTIALMKRINLPLPAMMTIAVVFSFLGTFLSNYRMQGPIQYFLGLFYTANDITSFPLFLWLYYPVAGMVFAYYLLRTTNKKKFYTYTFIIGVIGLIIVSVSYILCGIDLKTMFILKDRIYYKQTPLHLLFTTFVILIGMSIYYLLSVVVKSGPVTKAVSYLGTNLDVIYIDQWLVICYIEVGLTLAKVDKLQIAGIVPMAIVVLLISVGISAVYLRFIKPKLISFAERISPKKEKEA